MDDKLELDFGIPNESLQSLLNQSKFLVFLNPEYAKNNQTSRLT